MTPRGTKRASGKVTLARIAEELGVTPMTVSNAYNRPEQLSAELRERVLATAQRLGYPGPSPLARSLRRGYAGAVGVLYPNKLSYAFQDAAAASFLAGVSSALEAHKLTLSLLPSSPLEAHDASAVREALLDGLIVYSVAEDDPALGAALERQLPLVIVDQPQRAGIPFIGSDNEGAAFAAAQHLLGFGHRSFGILSFALTREPSGALMTLGEMGNPTFALTEARLQGYRRALLAAGISADDVPLYEGRDSTVAEGQRGAGLLFAAQQLPTALLCLSDALASGALEALNARGLEVPAEVSVIGFDDSGAALNARPQLSTVHQPHFDKGHRAAEALLEQLQGGKPEATTLLPAPLVIRASTGPAPKH